MRSPFTRTDHPSCIVSPSNTRAGLSTMISAAAAGRLPRPCAPATSGARQMSERTSARRFGIGRIILNPLVSATISLMAKPADIAKLAGLATRFGAFVAERHPFALADAVDAFETVTRGRASRTEAEIDALAPALRRELSRRLEARPLPSGLAEPTPRVSPEVRIARAFAELLDDCDGF